MLKGLAPGAIGVTTRTLEDRVAAAKTGGFEAVEIDVKEVADRLETDGTDAVLQVLGDIEPAGWGLPTDWRSSEEKFRADLLELPRLAGAAAAIGCHRTFTWIMPGSNDLPLEDNLRFHVDRFTSVAAILEGAGCRLGLEYIGPKTLRDQFKHPFLFTAEGMLNMAQEIGPNVGLLLDAWHWYTSGETADQLRQLSESDIVYVHVNDAPAGIDRDEQVDNTRALPGETGVIPIKDFLQALRDIGYDGPVVPEPFKKELADLPSDEDRLRLVGASMDKILGR
jgi:sugar phosphate isomerase/epimerase